MFTGFRVFNTGNKFIDEGKLYQFYGKGHFPRNLYQAMVFCSRNSKLHDNIKPGAKLRMLAMPDEIYGAASPNDNQIFINPIIFSDKFYDDKGIDESSSLRAMLAVLIFSHIEVHEAAHCLLTNAGSDGVLGLLKSVLKSERLAEHPLVNQVFQLCEDIFIEHIIRLESGVIQFVDNAYYFTQNQVMATELIAEYTKIADGDYSEIEKFISPTDILFYTFEEFVQNLLNKMKLGILATMRNTANRIERIIEPVSAGWQIINDELLVANKRKAPSSKERVRIAIRVLQALLDMDFSEINEDELEMKLKADEASNAEQKAKQDQVNEVFQKMIKQIQDEINGSEETDENGEPIENEGKGGSISDSSGSLNPNKEFGDSEANAGELDKEGYSVTDENGNAVSMGVLTDEFNEARKEEEQRFAEAPKGTFKHSGSRVTFDYKTADKYMGNGTEYEPNPEFSVLAYNLRHAKGQTPKAEIPMQSGNKILRAHLPRIITDGKILAYPNVDRQNVEPPEVIMLIDISGSTDGDVREAHANPHDPTYKHMRGKPLYRVEAEAVLGAMQSLQSINVPCAAYAHSTSGGYSSGQTTAVYGIASYKMPFPDEKGRKIMQNHRDLTKRFGALKHMPHLGNADGDALAYVSQFFTDKRNTKIILVFSDGYPTDGGVDARNPREYLKDVIKTLRDNKIHVMSFSVVSTVVDHLDDLYGKEYNVKAYGNLLVPELSKVIAVIAR